MQATTRVDMNVFFSCVIMSGLMDSGKEES